MGKNIVLCGFMGSGKSTVGKALAKLTGREYVDMDIYIEKQQNKTIKDIFAESGEDYFRDLEHKASIELSKKSDLIISAGGGTLLYKRNIAALSETGIIVLLDVSLSNIRYRLRNDKKRPLLQRPDKNKVMAELYKIRLPKYKAAAQVTIKAQKPPVKVAKDIIKTLDLECKKK